MAIVPDKLVDQISFFEDHASVWLANAVAIGSTTAEITALNTKTDLARAALSARAEAQNTAKAKTVSLHTAVDTMLEAGNDVILKIKAKAAVDGNSVYSLAELPPPAPPGPVPAPGKPTSFVVRIQDDGSLILSWKCPNPENSTGTIYQVSRKIGEAADFTIIGASGSRSFIDAALPTNSSPITYKIIAVRSTVAGPPATFTVTFGTGSSGQMMASVVQVGGSGVSAPKLAA